MKIKSNIFLFLIIVCILLSISTASASQLQADNGDNNFQDYMGIDQNSDLNTVSEFYEDNLKSNTEPNNLKKDSGDASRTFTQFHDDLINSEGEFNLSQGDNEEWDETSFTALSKDINQSGEVLNLTHDYIFNESIDNITLLDKYNILSIPIEKSKLY